MSAIRRAVRRLSPAATPTSTPAPTPDSAPAAQQPAPPKAPIVGIVEHFTRKRVIGWVSVPADQPPVRVTLRVGGLVVSSTYATSAGPVSPPDDEAAAYAEMRAALPRRLRSVPAPTHGGRNSQHEIRGFAFRVDGLWKFTRKGTKIRVNAGGRPLPIAGHGMFLLPRRRGEHSPHELKQRLAEGHVLTHRGQIQLSKKLDTDWQARVSELYTRARATLAESGLDLFLVYGTLLGAVREGTVIGHDDDFDAAFVSKATTGPAAAEELKRVAHLLIGAGFDVEARPTALHVHHHDDPTARIDIFHLFFADDGRLRFPFGVAGASAVTAAEWGGVEEIDFIGGRALVPHDAESVVAMIYGDDWHHPKPGFTWALDRTDHAPEGELSDSQVSAIYWANFYADTEFVTGSTFQQFVAARDDVPDLVIDIGCGDGRDACAFGSGGRRVLGLDRSEVGIDHARKHAEAAGVADRVSFAECDVADADRLSALIAAFREANDGAVLFYLRFFLHSVTAEVQDALLGVLAAAARDGDLIAAEFRSDKDADQPKVYGQHYRRFQSGAEFAADLTHNRGFSLRYEHEGTGLSPYRGEDPVLYRAIGARG